MLKTYVEKPNKGQLYYTATLLKPVKHPKDANELLTIYSGNLPKSENNDINESRYLAFVTSVYEDPFCYKLENKEGLLFTMSLMMNFDKVGMIASISKDVIKETYNSLETSFDGWLLIDFTYELNKLILEHEKVKEAYDKIKDSLPEGRLYALYNKKYA